MDSSPAFTLGEHYRIQNVDFGEYLEMVRRPAGSKLVLRPYKAFSENQQVCIGVNVWIKHGFTLRQSGHSRHFRPVKGILFKIAAVLFGRTEPRLTFTGMGTSHSTERKLLAFILHHLERSTCKVLNLSSKIYTWPRQPERIKLLHANETASRLLCSNGGDTSTVCFSSRYLIWHTASWWDARLQSETIMGEFRLGAKPFQI